MEKGYYKFYVDALEDHWDIAMKGDDPAFPILKLNVNLTHHSTDKTTWNEIEETTVECALFFYGKAQAGVQAILNQIGFNGDFKNPEFDAELYQKGQEVFAVENQQYENRNGELCDGFKIKTFPKPIEDDYYAQLNSIYKQY